ncbi:AAA family ATPase [Brachyspira pilosicoli]|uniref:AAA family ATPase n=1 Tax=Brachyspira pilosicoli TaxID=52584 RepID=UPI003007DAEB
MATYEQIKTLIKYHYDNDQNGFYTTALQIAAYEAKNGHEKFANDIKKLIDKKQKENNIKIIANVNDFSDLVIVQKSDYKMNNLIVNANIKLKLNRIIDEYKLQSKIKKYGLDNRRKLLLSGQPGVGKTLTASVIAGELSLPLHIVMIDKIITKYFGETSAKLRKIFDLLYDRRAVYLFDEFDAIGAERNLNNDIGEIRRVLNSFLQFIEQDKSNSIIVAATNNPKILDQALYRRFDDIIYYSLPSNEEIKLLINYRLGDFKPNKLSFAKILEKTKKLSHAEIVYACDNAIKEAILNDRRTITQSSLIKMIEERKNSYKFKDKK